MGEETRSFNIPLEGIEGVTLGGVSADLSVHPTVGKELVLKIDLKGADKDVKDYNPLITKTGNSVKIELEPWKERWFSLFKRRLDLRVVAEIPESIKNLNLGSVSGDIDVSDLSAEMFLSSVSGDIRVNKCNSSLPLSFKTVSGDVGFKEIDIRALKGRTVSGDIHIMEARGGSLDVSSISGDVSITSSAFESSKRISTTSGEIDFDGLSIPNARSDLTSVSGDVELRFRNFPSLRLEYHTSSGDFKPKLKGSFSKVRNHTYIFTVGGGEEKYNVKTTSGDLIVSSLVKEPEPSIKEEDEEVKTVRKLYEEGKITMEEMRALLESMGYSEEEIETYCREGGKGNE